MAPPKLMTTPPFEDFSKFHLIPLYEMTYLPLKKGTKTLIPSLFLPTKPYIICNIIVV